MPIKDYNVEHNYHDCICITNFTQEPIPLEVLAMLEELDEDLKWSDSLREYDKDLPLLQCTGSQCNRMDKEIEWSIDSGFEGGSCPIWQVKEQQWVYRDSWDGRDHKVPGGRGEVVANSMCIATEG